jgi:tetratricopeptide (TPR) repeat protein
MAPSKFPPHCAWNRPRRASAMLGPFLLVLILAPGIARAQDNAAKARAVVNSAIQMTNSDEAVKLLWQATEIDPTLEDPYVYLGVYYNSRSDFASMIKVYQKLIKYRPNEVSAYLNIGEAYMSFTPPRLQEALTTIREPTPWIPRTRGPRSGSAKFSSRTAIARKRRST